MTNLLTESTPNIIHELLDDIKENVIQINEKCTCAPLLLLIFALGLSSRRHSLERHQADQHHESAREKERQPGWIGSARVNLVRFQRHTVAIDPDEQANRTDSSAGTSMVVLVPEESTGQRLARESDETSDIRLRRRILGVSDTESSPADVHLGFSLFNHLRVASRLPPSCDYMLFKNSILPCWEDPQNSSGGRWVLYFSKSEQVFLNLDVCWLASVSSSSPPPASLNTSDRLKYRCWH